MSRVLECMNKSIHCTTIQKINKRLLCPKRIRSVRMVFDTRNLLVLSRCVRILGIHYGPKKTFTDVWSTAWNVSGINVNTSVAVWWADVPGEAPAGQLRPCFLEVSRTIRIGPASFPTTAPGVKTSPTRTRTPSIRDIVIATKYECTSGIVTLITSVLTSVRHWIRMSQAASYIIRTLI